MYRERKGGRLFTVFSGQGCINEAIDTSELSLGLDICRLHEFQIGLPRIQRIWTLRKKKKTHSSTRCNWTSSGKGSIGTQPSLTHMRPTLVSTWECSKKVNTFIGFYLINTVNMYNLATGKARWCRVRRRMHSTLFTPSPWTLIR